MYLPPVQITRGDWYPATYRLGNGRTLKVMATDRMTRYVDGHTYTWVRISQRTNLPTDHPYTYATGERFFALDRNLTPRTPRES